MDHRLGGMAWLCSGMCSCGTSAASGDDLLRHVFSVWHRVCAGLMTIGDISMLLHSRSAQMKLSRS